MAPESCRGFADGNCTAVHCSHRANASGGVQVADDVRRLGAEDLPWDRLVTSSTTGGSLPKQRGLDRSGSGEAGNGPIDRRDSGLGQVVVDLGEAAAAEEMACGERRRMGGGDDAMGFGRDEGELASGVVAPQEEDDPLWQVADRLDDGVGEGFPALAAMAAGVSGGDGEDGVQQQHALVGPGFEAAVVRPWQSEIGAEFLVDVPQGTGDRADIGSD